MYKELEIENSSENSEKVGGGIFTSCSTAKILKQCFLKFFQCLGITQVPSK